MAAAFSRGVNIDLSIGSFDRNNTIGILGTQFNLIAFGISGAIPAQTVGRTDQILRNFALVEFIHHNALFGNVTGGVSHAEKIRLTPQYIAVREQSREKHQHYHVALLLDGQKTQSIHNHIQTAERLWDTTLGLPARENGYGLIDDCTTSRTGEKQVNGVMLRPDDPDMEAKKADCFRRASYLAKTNTKGNAPKGQREMFSSRISK